MSFRERCSHELLLRREENVGYQSKVTGQEDNFCVDFDLCSSFFVFSEAQVEVRFAFKVKAENKKRS